MTYTLADTDEGKAINVRVAFTDDSGNAADADQSRPRTRWRQRNRLPAPSDLTAAVDAEGDVVLNWTAPDDDTITGYQILRRRPREGENTLAVYVENTGSAATTWTDTAAPAGTVYVYRVKAINAAGVWAAVQLRQRRSPA